MRLIIPLLFLFAFQLQADPLEGRQFYSRGISGTMTVSYTILDTTIDTTYNLADADMDGLGNALYFTDSLVISIDTNGDTTDVSFYFYDTFTDRVTIIDSTGGTTIGGILVFDVTETAQGVELYLDSFAIADSGLTIIIEDLTYYFEEFTGTPIAQYREPGSSNYTGGSIEGLRAWLFSVGEKSGRLSIFDAGGKTVHSSVINGSDIRLNPPDLPDGRYFYRLYGSSKLLRSGSFVIRP